MHTRPFHYVALGDSITAGHGVPEGAAYPDLVFRALRHSPECRLENLAISGITSGELLTLLRRKFAPRLHPASLVSLSIGGNDFLRRLTRGHLHPYSYFQGARRLWATIPAIVQEICRLAPAAHVFVLGFYNPYPTAWRGYGLSEWMVRRLNRQYRKKVERPRVVFLDLARVLPQASRDWLCDGIHPSVQGHRRIAGTLLAVYRMRKEAKAEAVPTRPAYRRPPDAIPISAF
ncbi:MAG: SGNH/GDSL hydrolase family protein [Alicyclobacillaceae bacterium]|nr:SGNH/GDSL hydrolase family protein [Alicyclobacillaceae bacterium]